MFSEFLKGPQPTGLERHKRRIFEDEEAIGKVLPDLIAQKRAGKNAPAGSNEVMKQNAMSVKGKGDNITVQTPQNWKGTPILQDVLKQQSDVALKVGRSVKDDRVPGGADTTPQSDLGDKIKHSVSPEVLEEINRLSQKMTTPARVKKRKASNYNFGELVIGAALGNPDAQTIEDLKNHNLPIENIHNAEGYLKDLSERDPKTVLEFLQNFREQTRSFNFRPNPEDIWIRGAGSKNEIGPQSIIDAFVGRDDSATADLADILFRQDDRFTGISSKATKDAYGGSGGLIKLLDRISRMKGLLNESGEDFKLGSNLREIQQLMIRAAGLPMNDTESTALWGERGYKEHEDDYTDLLRDPNNPVFPRLDEVYQQFNPEIKEHLLNHLLPTDLPYDLWRFDGTQFNAQDRDTIDEDDISLVPIQNPMQNIERDKAAKLWFALMNGDVPMIKVENRVKSLKPWGAMQYAFQPWGPKDVLRPR